MGFSIVYNRIKIISFVHSLFLTLTDKYKIEFMSIIKNFNASLNLNRHISHIYLNQLTKASIDTNESGKRDMRELL